MAATPAATHGRRSRYALEAPILMAALEQSQWRDHGCRSWNPDTRDALKYCNKCAQQVRRHWAAMSEPNVRGRRTHRAIAGINEVHA